jgi:dihydroorotate dehydrogenase electron transfer subunit
MQQTILTIEKNEHVTRDVMKMVLAGAGLEEHRPGQFINIKIEDMFLRRPISVNDYEPGRVTLLYKIVGKGTSVMSRMFPGEKLDVLTGLGNGFDPADAGDAPLLVGGGIGTAPLYYLAKKLRAEGKDVTVILGFNNKPEIFYEDEFKALGCRVLVSTADGSYGVKGFVTDAAKTLISECAGKTAEAAGTAVTAAGEAVQAGLPWSYAYVCGPEPMLKAIYPMLPKAQLSFEERMGCGFGACMGCSCKTITGYKRICKDGPVLRREEILWEEHK